MDQNISTATYRQSLVLIKGVCFSPEKGRTLEAMALQKSPVELKKYSISTKYGRDDIVIDKKKKTSLIPIIIIIIIIYESLQRIDVSV